MPFKSKSQQRWMYANKPEMAKQWSEETPDHKALPEKASDAATRKEASYLLRKVKEKIAADALATAWDAIKVPIAATADAIAEDAKRKEDDEEKLQRAVDRHTRERVARQIAKQRVPKLGAYKAPVPSSERQHEARKSATKSLRKQAMVAKLCDLFKDLESKKHPKGVKVIKHAVKTIPIDPVKDDKAQEKRSHTEIHFCKDQRLKMAALVLHKLAARRIAGA
jgi:hypothetical protein|tara:strand:- start:375 stop:1043 length:669 start_codon:yes stop_codon:yes gene_type:complete